MDDWALRKGRTYGTILVDLERRRVLDLLADRAANTVAGWLCDHPGIAVASPTSDRTSLYSVQGGDAAALFELIAQDRSRVEAALGRALRVVCCHAAGSDGF